MSDPFNDPAYHVVALYDVLRQLVASHPKSSGEATWLLALEPVTPTAFDGPPEPAGPNVTMAVEKNYTYITVTRSKDDFYVSDGHELQLTPEVIRDLVPVLQEVLETDVNARPEREADCAVCGGTGLARPIWRSR